MLKVNVLSDDFKDALPPEELLVNKRHLTPSEIYVLIQNRNISSDSDWQNVYVCDGEGEFNPSQIVQSEFSGWVILGKIRKATLKFHDLELKTGVFYSHLENCITGDDCVIKNVSFASNYHIGNRVMLFNIQEISCTCHSKFGEGLLKEGEPEKNRIWIGAGNENDRRAVLPFTEMIPADAYFWSRYRDDEELMKRFVELTEYQKDKRNNTHGIIEDDCVIKNCTLIKDVKIGSCAYIKGAFKLKNITVLSSEDEPSQIGEGVEMVNGIMGYGSHVFYQAIAVRFIIGRNCQLKYGARLLNSVLGDNSVVSCCELLNNLIYPFHEQHHNSSFLIAATVMGQSNIASAATIGSNHNSRSPDGEMLAGRGFWPGLCSDFKYDSRFASFVLVAKGSYEYELNITYPFSLVASDKKDKAVHIIPAYWFLYNMFAIVRNKYKFRNRDRRVIKIQNIETNPFAPDTVQEILTVLDRIIELTARYLKSPEDVFQKMTLDKGEGNILYEYRKKALEASEEDVFKTAKDFLHHNKSAEFILSDDRCQKKYGALIYKAARAYKEYRRVLKYFIAETFMQWIESQNKEILEQEDLEVLASIPLYKNWVNAGGQVMPEEKVKDLFFKIKSSAFKNWQDVHSFYNDCQKNYLAYKARYCLYILEFLYSRPVQDFDSALYRDFMQDVAYVSMNMYESSVASREKDYTDFFRSITFRNFKEKEAVIGSLSENSFLMELKDATSVFDSSLEKLFRNLVSKK
ncbi:DUF4954 family protein [Treponema sp.]|uniref:DUF4954 family protein n=1 Tax=Treponema sp. TaxID=166 RepID=UPI0025EB6131|nr:DUF4954 family protein [Treponema sp.]MCR5218813.1 DUF4954 family protein [Treponema sp.]